MAQDPVDRILAQWQEIRPDLDPAPMGIWGRLARLTRLGWKQMDATFQPFGLTHEAFDVLATLRRAGAPYRLTPTQLFQSCMVSSGTMTNRIDRLEKAGLVTRLPDPADRRGTLIELTEQGRALVDQAVEAHLATEHAMLARLSAEERAQLAGLLRKLLLAIDA